MNNISGGNDHGILFQKQEKKQNRRGDGTGIRADGMILSREGIKLGLPSVSMEEAIIAAGELLRDLGYVDDDYIPAIIRRNEEASVYMGLGLAIPHGTEDEILEKLKTTTDVDYILKTFANME